MNKRELKFFEALREGLDLSMEKDKSVYVMGLGVPDPKGIFGTTVGLQKKYGEERVMDMPTSENGMTGIAIGSALVGMRPVMTHQRIDFALLAVEQIVNQAAKWHYMFGGKMSVPVVIRLIIGRGWGQGPQHSQSLQNWFAHIPGLKVVMPATPYDAKGLLISSIEDNNPVIFIEHRWLYNIHGEVPEGIYRVPIGEPRLMREGGDVTIVSLSYMTIEALKAADELKKMGIHADVIDVRTLRPFNPKLILESVKKTGRLMVADTSWKLGGFAGEVIATVVEQVFEALKCPPVRVALPEAPTPTTPSLSTLFYPGFCEMISEARKMMGMPVEHSVCPDNRVPLDVPHIDFTGPF